MTDKETIKALECCCEAELNEDCEKMKCPFFDNEMCNCMNVDDENALYRYALDLINRQKAEIERLKKILNTDVVVVRGGRGNGKSDTIKTIIEAWVAEIRAEAIKEFIKKCVSEFGCGRGDDRMDCYICEDDFFEIMKEMVGEQE